MKLSPVVFITDMGPGCSSKTFTTDFIDDRIQLSLYLFAQPTQTPGDILTLCERKREKNEGSRVLITWALRSFSIFQVHIYSQVSFHSRNRAPKNESHTENTRRSVRGLRADPILRQSLCNSEIEVCADYHHKLAIQRLSLMSLNTFLEK